MPTIKVKLDKRTLPKAVHEGRVQARTTDREVLVMDTVNPGFGIRVRPKRLGEKTITGETWIYHHECDKDRKRLKLGAYSENTFDEMKAKAASFLALHRQGLLTNSGHRLAFNPDKDTSSSPLDLTITEICDLYLESKVYKEKRDSTKVDIESKIRLYIKPSLGHIYLKNLTREQVICWRDGIKPASKHFAHCNGNTTANRAKEYLSGLITWFIVMKDLSIRNVCQGWPKLVAARKEEQRKEGISKQILIKLGNAFRSEYVTSYTAACECLLLDLLTGGRRGEIESALCGYVYIDKDVAMIEFPKGTTKHDHARVEKRTIFLGNLGKSIIEKHIKNKPATAKIFTQMKGGEGRISVKAVWNRIRKAADRPDLRAHGLRHLWTSAAKAIRTPLDVRECLLGHAAGDDAYGEYEPKFLAEEANRIENRILEELGMIDISSIPDLSSLLTAKAFCEKARIGKTSLYALIRDRFIEPTKVNGLTYIDIKYLNVARALYRNKSGHLFHPLEEGALHV